MGEIDLLRRWLPTYLIDRVTAMEAVIKAAQIYIKKADFYNNVARKADPDKYPDAWKDFQRARFLLRKSVFDYGRKFGDD